MQQHHAESVTFTPKPGTPARSVQVTLTYQLHKVQQEHGEEVKLYHGTAMFDPEDVTDLSEDSFFVYDGDPSGEDLRFVINQFDRGTEKGDGLIAVEVLGKKSSGVQMPGYRRFIRGA